ncbi:hypothetical protein C5167_046796 [Papaver somniferum]|uniref:Uncharacterized protein n=1 Tax=Papaver somniferum TaxID=3469 RepID=A0A4Y7LH27_PAPSO|nr:hypothetical protein C5167_046796 [Papaver somniferum]
MQLPLPRLPQSSPVSTNKTDDIQMIVGKESLVSTEVIGLLTCPVNAQSMTKPNGQECMLHEKIIQNLCSYSGRATTKVDDFSSSQIIIDPLCFNLGVGNWPIGFRASLCLLFGDNKSLHNQGARIHWFTCPDFGYDKSQNPMRYSHVLPLNASISDNAWLRAASNVCMTTKEVIEECKFFCFAGQDTTSDCITWNIIVLSMHQDWQDKAREEVIRICGKNPPQFESLADLKTVSVPIHSGFITKTRLRTTVSNLYEHYEDQTSSSFHHPCKYSDLPLFCNFRAMQVLGNDGPDNHMDAANIFQPLHHVDG